MIYIISALVIYFVIEYYMFCIWRNHFRRYGCMPLSKGTTKKSVNKNTEKLIHEGYKPDQAYAIAKSEQKKNKKKKAKKSAKNS